MIMKWSQAVSAALVAAISLKALPVHALNFSWTFPESNSTALNEAFRQAGDLWSSALTDDVTIRLTAGTGSLSSGTLGQSAVMFGAFSYSQVVDALYADRSSEADYQAVSSLSSTSSFGLLINRTADNPYGSGSASWYVDNNNGSNNSMLRVTTGNAKAMGICTYTGTDAIITINQNYSWDYDSSNGISADSYDLVGVIVHEIGHELGFTSGVDYLDSTAPPAKAAVNADNIAYVETLDLFRYSTESALAGVIDWTADNRTKYFSIDNGATELAEFSTGRNFGDGRQASHWKTGNGTMDPTVSKGNLVELSASDFLAMDVIGWNPASDVDALPEPSVVPLLSVGLIAAMMARRHCRSSYQQAA